MTRVAWQTGIFWLIIVGMPTLASLGRVWVRQSSVSLGYVLSLHQQSREQLKAELVKLELQRAEGRAPAKLAQMADRLGLLPPRPQQLLAQDGPITKTKRAPLSTRRRRPAASQAR